MRKFPKRKTVDGKQLMADNFALVPNPHDPSTWRLPIHTREHAEKSLERIFQTSIPPMYFHEVRSRITGALRKFSPSVTLS